MPETLLLRTEEVAELLNISKSKVYELLASGKLPCVRIDRSVRISRRALERWIAEREGEDVPNVTGTLEFRTRHVR